MAGMAYFFTMFTIEFIREVPGGGEPEVLHRASYSLTNLDAAKEKAKSLLSIMDEARAARILDSHGVEIGFVRSIVA